MRRGGIGGDRSPGNRSKSLTSQSRGLTSPRSSEQHDGQRSKPIEGEKEDRESETGMVIFHNSSEMLGNQKELSGGAIPGWEGG